MNIHDLFCSFQFHNILVPWHNQSRECLWTNQKGVYFGVHSSRLWVSVCEGKSSLWQNKMIFLFTSIIDFCWVHVHCDSFSFSSKMIFVQTEGQSDQFSSTFSVAPFLRFQDHMTTRQFQMKNIWMVLGNLGNHPDASCDPKPSWGSQYSWVFWALPPPKHLFILF